MPKTSPSTTADLKRTVRRLLPHRACQFSLLAVGVLAAAIASSPAPTWCHR
ncbi:MAG: hypothetical protein ACLS3M_08835 [Collinsella sp.]